MAKWEIIEDNKFKKQGEGKTLPMAQNGLLTKIKSTLNPLNIGVPDYTDKYKTWNEAYSAAKKAGLSEIMWNKGPNPGRKNLDYAGTPAQEMKSYGITGEQRVFNPSTARKNLGRLDTEKGYDTELSQVFKQLFDSKNPAVVNNEEPAYGIEKDAFRLYLGLPQEMNSFTPSKYQKGAFEIVNYNQMLPEVLDENIENLIKTKGNPEKEFKYGEHIIGGNSPIKPYGDIVMGKHTVKKGKDDKGEYIEYADKWDLDSYKVGNVAVGQIADMVNKPLPIYGRVYYKDYGDGVKRKMYYSDNELKSFSTDKNNKNFNALDLQKELVNRGYELPNSMQQDDYGNINFDGIYGNETKQALQDFQSNSTPAPKMAVSLPGQSTALPPELKHGGKVSGWEIIDDVPKAEKGLTIKTPFGNVTSTQPVQEKSVFKPIPITVKPQYKSEGDYLNQVYGEDSGVQLPGQSSILRASQDAKPAYDVAKKDYASYKKDFPNQIKEEQEQKTAEQVIEFLKANPSPGGLMDKVNYIKNLSPADRQIIENSYVGTEDYEGAKREYLKNLTATAVNNPLSKDFWNYENINQKAQGVGANLYVNKLGRVNDLLNVPYMMGEMTPGVVNIPYNLSEGNYGAAAMGLAGPISLALLAPEAKGFFGMANNLLNPLVGIVDANTVKSAGKYLTEKTPLKNAYKVNPWAFKPNSEMMYRGIGEAGMKDALESGVFRAKQNVEPLMEDGFNMAKQFEGTYYTPKFKTADQYGAGYIAEVPKDVTDFRLRYKGKGNKNWSQIADENIPIDKGKILQKDWLKGYKEIPKPASSFKSEINWGNWNKEIPENKALMQEYNAIEQQAKANGTWMKNPDGSLFQGTPEQFIQQNSQNFKSAFPDGHLSSYRGSQVYDPTLDKGTFTNVLEDQILFGSTDKPTAEYYATNGAANLDHLFKDVGKKPEFFHPDKSIENIYTGNIDDVNPGMYQYALDKKLPTITAEGAGKYWHNVDNNEVSEWLKTIKPENANNRIGASWDPNLVTTDDVASYMVNKKIPIGVSKNTIDAYKAVPSDVIMSNNKLARPKSLMYNNGMFDMTNPNIYKSVAPYIGYTGAGALTYKGLQGLGSKPILQQQKNGGIIEDPRGQWAHPGLVTRIPSNQITMQGVNYPVLGISDRGHTQMMYPGEDYSFRGKSVTEYPMMGSGGEVNFTYAGENHRVYEKESPTGNGKGIEGHIMVNHPTENKGKWDTIDLTKITNGKVKTVAQGVASTKKWHKENPEYADGGMIKRADGSYSKRGLWDNIRDNAGSGKKPTKEMLKQERKIKSQYTNGGKVSSWEIIEDLPKAGNGLISEITSTLNPKNWGVKDYTKSGTRDQAYAAARKAGVKEFMWNNERFSTDMAGTPAQQLKWSGITNSQTENRSFFTPVNFAKDRLRKNLVPYGYTNPAGRVYDAIVKDKSTPFVSEDKHTVLGLKDVSPERRDAFKLYMNNPQENNTFGISNYTPSLKDKNSNSNNGPYYKINNLYGPPNEIDDNVNFMYNLNKNSDSDRSINFQNDIMGHYKTSIGSDERGNYMSYYDKWDLNPKEVKNPITGKEIPTDIGKPFEIYDRVYFKDYGDGEEKRMYYTDKELKSFNTDKNTKNFDTIALQKELYNRGYKLPNSVKVVEGSRLKFDGILGDETKKALQDFQNKKVEAPKMAVQKPGQSEALPPQFQKGGKTKKSNWQIIEY